jgi:hypothetical protein
MRKVIRYSVSATVTFTLGVFLASSLTYFFPKRVSLCMLAGDPAAYDRKMVRIEALGSVTSSPLFSEHNIIIFEPGCTEPDGWATIDVKESHLSAEVETFINSPQYEVRNAKVVIVGRFDQRASLGCFSPRFGIKATAVDLVSLVSSEPLPKMPTRTSP